MPIAFAPDTKGSSASPIAVAGGVWLLFGALTFSGSYSTGGDTLDLTKYFPAMGTIRQVVPLSDGIKGFTMDYDLTNKKLRLFVATAVTPAAAEHAAAAYLALLTAAPVPAAFLIK